MDHRNSRGESALHKAALSGRNTAICWLLDNKEFNIDINSITQYVSFLSHFTYMSLHSILEYRNGRVEVVIQRST